MFQYLSGTGDMIMNKTGVLPDSLKVYNLGDKTGYKGKNKWVNKSEVTN